MTFVKALKDCRRAESTLKSILQSRSGASWATFLTHLYAGKALVSHSCLADHIQQLVAEPHRTPTSSHARQWRTVLYYSHSAQLMLAEDDVEGAALQESLEEHHKLECLEIMVLGALLLESRRGSWTGG